MLLTGIYRFMKTTLKKYQDTASKGYQVLVCLLVTLLFVLPAKADLTKDVEPTSVQACQPNASTPFATSFTVGKGTGCGNLATAANVTFIWEYFNGGSWVTVANNTPAGFTYSNASVRIGSGSNAQITNTLTVTLSSSATTGTFSFRCRANQPSGCTNFVISNTITVTVYAKPTPTFTAQPGASACANGSVTYTTQAGQSGYTWGIPGVSGTDYIITAGSTSTNTVTLKWLTTGNKTVTINYTNSNGCTAASPTSSTTTTVNAAPAPTFTAQPSGTICSNTDVTYTTQAGQSSYVWNVPGVLNTDYTITSGGIGAGSNTVTLQWLTSGNKVVTINYNNASGCSAATATSSNTITVTVRPVPSFTVSPGAAICSGTDITYTTQSGQSNYTWTVGGILNTDYTIVSGGIGAGNNTVTVKWLTAGNKTVTVNYTSSSCTGLSAASSNTAVTVRPVATFTSAPGGNTCAGTDVTYTTQPGQSNYVWTAEGTQGVDYTIISGGTGAGSNTVTLQWLTTGSNRTVTVNYNNAGGCNALTAASSTTLINARPTPTFTTSPDATSCVNAGVTYTTQAAQSNYVWSIGGILNTDYNITAGGIGAADNTVTLKWLTAGNKTVTVNYTNGSGCAGVSAASSSTTVNIPTTPTITPGSSTTFCAGGSVVLTSSAGSGYQWYSDGIIIPGATSINYTATASALYSVKVVNGSGCDATSGSTTVTVDPLPSIDPSAQAGSLCFSAGAQSTTLDYTNAINDPATYSIIWNAAAASAGFSAVTNAVLPVSPITIAVPAAAPANTYTGTITVTNTNTCTSTGKTFTVTIASAPDVTDFSTSAADGCEGTGTTVTVNSSTILNGTYIVTYDLSGTNTATGNTATMVFSGGVGTFTATALNQGSTSITVTQVAAIGCGSFPASGNTATFTINSLPSVSPITGLNSVCIGNAITLSNATLSGTWSSADVLVASVNSSGVVSGISANAVDITYTTAPVNGCINSIAKNITVNALPPATPITGTTTLCINTTTALGNSSPGGTWKSSNASVATISNAGVVTAVSAGTTTVTYIFPANANGCTDSVYAVVTVDPAATVNAGSTVTVCQSASPAAITLSGSSVGGGASTGAWSIVGGGGSLSNITQTADPSTVTYTPASNFSGTVTLLLTTNAPGSCAAVTATKTINVSQIPTAGAGSAVTVCQSASPSAVTLSGATLGGGATTGAWSITTGSGALSNTAQNTNPETVTFTPAANFSGTVTLTLTTNISGACTAATATKTINVTAAATVIAGGPNTVCQGSSAITLSGAGFGGGAASAAWSITAGGGILSSTTQTASPATVTYTPAAAFTGTVTLTITTNAPSGCSATSTTRTINVSAPAAANAGGPNTVCQSSSPAAITLSGASVSGGATTGAWSIISGGGALSSTVQTATPATVTYTPAANFTGTVTLRLTTNIPGGCTAATADRTINVTAAPTSNAGTAVLTCSDVSQTASGVAAVNITAGSSASNQTSVLWSSSGTGTFANPTSLTTATYTPSAADKAAGSVTLTLTAFGNAPCGNATSTKTFTITPAINITDANNWSQVPDCNGLGVRFTLPAAPAGGNGTFAYQWMQKNNCGTAGTSTPVPGATGTSFIPPADNCYWLQISSGGCTVPQNLVGSTTRLRPSADTAALSNVNFGVGGSNPQICIGSSTTLTAQSSVSYTYTWSPATGLSATTGASVVANPSSTTIYTITAVATDGTGCTKTAKDTVTVSPLTVAGSVPASAVACNSGSATINLTGNTGNITRWESSTDGGTTWSPIANTTTTLNYTIAAATTLYRALVQSGACASAYTNATQTGLHNMWQGKTSTDWQTATNWSDQALPSPSCPVVTIPAATPYSPILNSGVATINSLVINSSASLTIANNANMQLAGTITNNGTFDVTDGSLEFNGASPQNISGNAFVSNTVRNLVLSNITGLTVNSATGNLLNIKEAFAFGNVNNTTLTTNDNLVLLSSAAGTARVADITNNNVNSGNAVSGKVTIQRYIPGRRAWRLLTAPVTLSSLVKISDAWQEGAARVTNPATIDAANNPNPGYGTHVTYGFPATNGYDQGVNGNPSIVYLTPTGWNGIPTATNNGATLNSGYITDQPGYMLFVRGDRSTQLSQATYAATTPTVLRIKGNINAGQLNISLTPGMVFGGSHFRVIGNPYPSAINFHKIIANTANNAAGFADAFYFWDPSLTGSNGVGGWVGMSYNNVSGTYDRTVLLGGSSTINNSGDIQSGSAFVIDYAGAASSIRIEEPNKVSGSNNSQFRPVYQPNQVRVSLMAKNPDNTVSVNDGVLVTYHDLYNSGVDGSDMRKLLNFAENIAIVKDSASLVLERRKTFEKTDTISLQLSKMRQKDYQLQVALDEMDAPEGTIALLEDKVLNSQKIIDPKTTGEYDFTVSANNIAIADRFRLIFKPIAVFTSITAYQQSDDIMIGWSLSQEFNVNRFEIERSDDGVSFLKIAEIMSKGNSNSVVAYNWMDVKPGTGTYFYRVKAISNNNVTVYSNKVKIKLVNGKQGMFVFPNPVTNNIINLQMNEIEKGRYTLQLANMEGKQVTNGSINYNGGSFTGKIALPVNTPAGTYLLTVSSADGNAISLKVFVQGK